MRIWKIAKAVDPKPSPEFTAKLHAALMQKAREQKNAPRLVLRPAFWKWAPAAVAAVVICSTLWYFLAGDVRKTDAAWVEVLKSIQNSKAAQYEMVLLKNGKEYQRTTVYVSQDHRRIRQVFDDGKVCVMDFDQRKSLVLGFKERKAILSELTNTMLPEGFDYLEMLRTLHETSGKLVGQVQEAGQAVKTFRVNDHGQDIEIQVPVATGLPSRIEFRPGSSGDDLVEVLSDLRWNIDLSDDLFRLSVPAGYTLVDENVTVTDLLAALKLSAQMNGGKFPAGFDKQHLWDLVRQDLRRRGLARHTAEGGAMIVQETDEKARSALKAFMRGLRYVQTREQNGSWSYGGAGHALGEFVKPVAMFSSDIDNHVTIVWGDLRIQEMERSRLQGAMSKPAARSAKDH